MRPSAAERDADSAAADADATGFGAVESCGFCAHMVKFLALRVRNIRKMLACGP